MGEDNNNGDEFKVVFSAEKDKSFDSTVNDVNKKLENVQSDKKIKLSMDKNSNINKEYDKQVKKLEKKNGPKLRFSIDPKSRIGAEYEKQFSKWNALMKVKTSNMPFGLGRLFKDQRELSDMEKYFGKLKLTAMKGMSDINDELDKKVGKNRKGEEGSDLFDIQGAWDASKEALLEAQAKLEQLQETRKQLMARDDKLKILPDKAALMVQLQDVQSVMEKLNKVVTSNTFGSKKSNDDISKSATRMLSYFQDAISKALALQQRGQKDQGFSFFDKMIEDVQNEKVKIDTAITDVQKRINQLTRARKDVKDTMKEVGSGEGAEELNSQLDTINEKITLAKNELERLNIAKQLNTQKLQIGEQEWLNRENNPKAYDRGFKTTELDSQARDAYNKSNKARDNLANVLNNTYTQDYQRIAQFQFDTNRSKATNIQDQMSQLPQLNNAKITNQKQIAQTDEEIKKTEKTISLLSQETKQWSEVFVEVTNRVKELEAELAKINIDLQNNPLRTDFMSNTMKVMNNETESMNLKWQSGFSIWEKLKSAISGVTGYIKKITPLTKLWHKVILNIYSQIATLVNPLNVFRRAWDDWINRWDNLPIKNTFEVIAYNLTTIVAPLLEKITGIVLNLLQYVNVFTKRWFGVDLFDKQAWAAEKFKKQIGQLTASFDELHSSSTNPNEYNTIFDTGDITLDPLAEETVTKLEGWADRIANAFQWIIDNWKTLVALWAGFTIAKGLWNLFKAFGGLSNTIGGLPGLWTTFKKALPIAGMVVGGTLYLYNSISLAKNWNQLTEEERQSKMNWGSAGSALFGGSLGYKIGGASGLVTGGLIGYGVGSTTNAITAYQHGDKESVESEATKAGTAFGGAVGMTVGKNIGASVGTALGGPIGAVLGTLAGAALGALVGNAAGKIANWFQSDGDYANLKVTVDDLTAATEQLTEAQNIYNTSLLNLKILEEQTGQSGEKLYQAVQNGTLSVDNMTASQLQVYQAYVNTKDAMEQLHTAQQTQMDYETSMDLERAKHTDNYQGYIDKMMQANEDGIYSNDELMDRLSQVYAKLDKNSREAFMEHIPENMREGIETGAEQYYSGWDKFCTNAKNLFSDLGDWIGNFFSDLWSGITGFFESSWNWVTGQGFKTNEQIEREKKDTEQLAQIQTQRDRLNSIKDKIPADEYNKVMNDLNSVEQSIKNRIASYDVGTPYVPNDQLAYVHKGEAIIPAKYNKPYTGNDNSALYSVIDSMNQEIGNLRQLIQEGIPVTGTFKQKGSDLLAVTERAKSKRGNNPISNPAYAR